MGRTTKDLSRGIPHQSHGDSPAGRISPTAARAPDAPSIPASTPFLPDSPPDPPVDPPAASPPSPPASRSGLDRLSAVRRAARPQTAEEARREFWSLYGATPAVFQRWAARDECLLVEALALHLHLNPEALRLHECRLAHVQALSERYASMPENPVRHLLQLSTRVGRPVRLGRGLRQLLGVREPPDPLWARASLAQHRQWIECRRDWLPAPELLESLDSPLEPPVPDDTPDAQRPLLGPLHGYVPRTLACLSALYQLFRPVQDGGTFEPGNWRTLPDTRALFWFEFADLPHEYRKKICYLLCPPGFGRDAGHYWPKSPPEPPQGVAPQAAPPPGRVGG